MQNDDYLKKKRKIDIENNQSSMSMNKPFSNINQFNYKEYCKNYYLILENRKKLPAWDARSHLIQLVKEHQILILQGETGSGKTTQIPQFLVEAGYINK